MMNAVEGQSRPLLSVGLGDLTDSDVVVEITVGQEWSAGHGPRLTDPIRDALSASYSALAGDNRIDFETVAVLEEVSKRRVTIWLRAHSAGSQGGFQDASLLKFLARGTLTLIGWMDGPSSRLASLQQALAVLAAGTSRTITAQSTGPTSTDLMKAVGAWQAAKDSFRQGDSVRILMEHSSANLNLGPAIEDPSALLVEKKLVSPPIDMIFIVEVPDYRATGEWQLRHGEAHVIGTCGAGPLDRFYRRELDIRPGDALHCRVEFETSYGPDYEVLAERFRIVEVIEVLASIGRSQVPSVAPSVVPIEVQKEPDDHKIANDFVERVEGDFGILTLRRLPIH
jgi:hypothetical protein